MAYAFGRSVMQIGLFGTMLVLACSACGRAWPTEQTLTAPTALETPAAGPVQPTPTLGASPSPEVTVTISHGSLDKHRLQTAREAFGVAQGAAQAWQQDAIWYGVMPSSSLERTLALPMAQPGWVFRFGAPDSEKEYIVQVVEGEIAGRMELRVPEYIEPSLAHLNPLDPTWAELSDNSALVEEYARQDNNVFVRFPDMSLDYRLVHPRKCEHPVWTLFDARHLAEPLFVMDASTRKALVDPFCSDSSG